MQCVSRAGWCCATPAAARLSSRRYPPGADLRAALNARTDALALGGYSASAAMGGCVSPSSATNPERPGLGTDRVADCGGWPASVRSSRHAALRIIVSVSLQVLASCHYVGRSRHETRIVDRHAVQRDPVGRHDVECATGWIELDVGRICIVAQPNQVRIQRYNAGLERMPAIANPSDRLCMRPFSLCFGLHLSPPVIAQARSEN
jgi:hypothetical protein